MILLFEPMLLECTLALVASIYVPQVVTFKETKSYTRFHDWQVCYALCLLRHRLELGELEGVGVVGAGVSWLYGEDVDGRGQER